MTSLNKTKNRQFSNSRSSVTITTVTLTLFRYLSPTYHVVPIFRSPHTLKRRIRKRPVMGIRTSSICVPRLHSPASALSTSYTPSSQYRPFGFNQATLNFPIDYHSNPRTFSPHRRISRGRPQILFVDEVFSNLAVRTSLFGAPLRSIDWCHRI